MRESASGKADGSTDSDSKNTLVSGQYVTVYNRPAKIARVFDEMVLLRWQDNKTQGAAKIECVECDGICRECGNSLSAGYLCDDCDSLNYE